MAKAFSYIRFSTPEQSKGDSLRRQLEGAREWCAVKGIQLDESIRDLGRSAFRGNNAQFGALREFLLLVESGQIERGSYLLVESLDRLSREAVLDAVARLLDLIRAGITVVTLSDKQEYSDARLRTDWTPLIISIAIMARAHEESLLKSQRVGTAWAQKRVLAQQDGQAMTSIAPAWLRLVGGPKTGRYELINERALIVRRIFDDTLAGLGRRRIAAALNQEGVDTWGLGGKKGERWHDSYIQKVLGNPAVYGRFEPLSKRAGGDGSASLVLDAYFPAVIDEATFFAAKAVSGSRRTGIGRPSTGHRNLLRGLARCHSCGKNLVLIDKGAARSSGPKLSCGSAHASAGCLDRTTYPYGMLETYILGALNDRLADLIVSADTATATARLQRDTMIERKRDREQRLSNLIELVQAGGGGTLVAKQTAALQIEIDGITAAIDIVDADVKGAELTRGAYSIYQFKRLQSQLRHGEAGEVERARAAIAQSLGNMVQYIVVKPDHAQIVLTDGGEAHVYGPISTRVKSAGA